MSKRNERTLILVKHAMPEIDPQLPAPQWPISAAGRAASLALAERLASYLPTRVVTSVEPKAADTGAIVAAALGLPVNTVPGLHEHDQGDAPFVGNDAWNATVAEVFARPDEVVLGLESANDAAARFAGAVAAVRDANPDDRIVIVAHGRVISLAVARANAINGFDLWLRLGLPSFVVLDPSDWKVIEVVDEVT